MKQKNISTGLTRELQASIDFHDSNPHSEIIPFLISSRLLRSLGAGQVDLARWEKNKNENSTPVIKILEIKGENGEISKNQLNRLYKAADFIGELLDMMVCLDCQLVQL